MKYIINKKLLKEFNNQFPENNLQGDELAAACTAFYLKAKGENYKIVIHPSEVNLEKFCQENNFKHEILNKK